MGAIQRMDHFTVVTDRLEETRVFYERLGLAVGPRPDFGIGGLWLYVGGHPVLHVIEVQQMPTPRRGALDHMAFMGGDAASTLGLLQQAGIAYRLVRLPRPYSTWQVFFQDPNGAEVEIDFDAAQAIPAALRVSPDPGQIRPS
ncbi:dioxygenase [Pelomonas aquatica]|uniref:Dioxygenase n=2 Tax=Pelomonas aquatica TaxID=431058 RepID=A0A9X4LI56_9BURK|nr:dioxygenase [Pelomonas aquatica]